MSRLTLEVQDTPHRTVVLAAGLVQMNPCHFTLGEVHGADVSNSTLFVSIHPDLLTHH